MQNLKLKSNLEDREMTKEEMNEFMMGIYMEDLEKAVKEAEIEILNGYFGRDFFEVMSEIKRDIID